MAMSNSDFLYTQTRDIALRPYQEDDSQALLAICSDTATQHLWAPNAEKLSSTPFKNYLERRIAHRWNHYRVIVNIPAQRIIGFAYCYNTVSAYDTSAVCLCMSSEALASLLAMRAAYLYFSHLLIDQHYRKLYLEVFDYNVQCRDLLKKLGFSIEGRFTQHQQWNNKYWDQWVFTLDRSGYDELCRSKKRLVERLSCKTQKN